MVIKKLNSIFHKHSRVLLLILAVLVIIPFVLGDFRSGGCDDPAATKVGTAFGEKVTVADLRQFAQNLMLVNGRQNSDDWQDIFNKYCYIKRAEQMGLTVTDDEIADELRKMFREEGEFSKELYDNFLKENNLTDAYLKLMIRSQLGEQLKGKEITDAEVDAAIRKKAAFCKQGKFSREVYNKFLKDRGIREDDLMASLRLNLLLAKLQKTVVSGIVVTDSEAEKFYSMATPGFELSVCCFENDKFKVAEPAEADLIKFYSEIKAVNPSYPEYKDVQKELPAIYKSNKQREQAQKFATQESAKLAKLKGDARKKAFEAIKFTLKKLTVPAAEAELEKMSKDQLAVQVYQLFNSNLPGILSALPQVEKMMGTLDIMPQMQQYMLYSQYMSMTGMLNQLFLAGIPQTFTMQAGDISPVMPISNGVVIVMVEKRIPSDMKDFAKNKAVLLKQLRSAKEQMAIQEFHENVMRQCSYTLENQAPQNGTEAVPAK